MFVACVRAQDDCVWEWRNPMPPAHTLNDMYFLDAHTGWAVGESGVVLKTTDGGATWTVKNAGTTAPLRSVHFVDAHRGWAIGGRGIIFKTTDGSETLVGAKGFWRLAFFDTFCRCLHGLGGG